MSNKVLSMAAILLFLSLVSIGCKKEDNNPTNPSSPTIVGTWRWVADSTTTYTLAFSTTDSVRYVISFWDGHIGIGFEAAGYEKYAIDGNGITFTSDWTGDGKSDVGKYTFSVISSSLSFSVVADSVANRKKIFTGSYLRQ
jgi:hypothetical protein